MIVEILVCAFATWAIVECIHHGSIFEERRAYFEASGGFFGELLSCPFCLSHWAAMLCVVAYEFTLDQGQGPLRLFRIFLCWLAATRLSNLMNDSTHFFNRTPKEPRTAMMEDDDAGTPLRGGRGPEDESDEPWPYEPDPGHDPDRLEDREGEV